MFKNKILSNASWIIGCKIVQSILNFIVTILIARFLGPSNYGVINYAASIVAFVVPLVQLGLGNVQVQEFIEYPNEEGRIVGSTLLLSIVSAIVCSFGIVAFVCMANAGEKETIIVCLLYSVILFFQGADLLQYWFQAHYISKYASVVSLVAFAIVTVYRIILLVKGFSVYWFAIVNALDYAIITIILLIIYHRIGKCKIRFSYDVSKRLLAKSKYYIISNMMIAVFWQTDKIMLNNMLNASATGCYSAAISCASLANFAFVAVIDSFRPLIFQNKKKSEKSFNSSIIKLYSVIIYVSVIESLLVCILSKVIINTIYGAEYYSAISALKIVVWYTTFSFIGMVRDVWILAENQQKWLGIINVAGALCNVGLNAILIPIWGINGAAFASVITQIFVNIIITMIIPATRPSIYLMYKSLNIKYMINFVKDWC